MALRIFEAYRSETTDSETDYTDIAYFFVSLKGMRMETQIGQNPLRCNPIGMVAWENILWKQ